VDFGLSDVLMEEATNLSYSLMKSLPIRGWESKDKNEETKMEMRSMHDYLFNADIASGQVGKSTTAIIGPSLLSSLIS
jgi:hypothetical protein